VKIFADQHIHTDLSPDSSAPAAAYTAKARQKGLTHLTLTQHMDVGHLNPLFNNPPSATAMLAAVRELANAAPEITVGFGVECGYIRQSANEVKKLLESLYQTNKLDFVLLSVHSVGGLDPYEDNYFQGRPLQEAYKVYLEALLESVEYGMPCHAIGHIGYVWKYSSRPVLEAQDFPALCDAILTAIIKAEKAIEINTSSLAIKGEPLPPASYLKRYVELGGRLVTFGSDAHTPGALAQGFGQARQIALDCGITEYAVYKKGGPVMAAL